MKLSLSTSWAFPFRSRNSRRRKLGHTRPRFATESVESRCLLSATNPLFETAWPQDCIVEHNTDWTIYESDYAFDATLPPGDYAFDLTFDETAFLETVPEWDTSQSWFVTDDWLNGYEEIHDSFQAAIDGTFNGFIDSLWYQDGQVSEFLGDVIYLTLESASGMFLPVDIFVSGGTAETVLASGEDILQQVKQMLVAPENNLFDTSGNLQAFDVSVNLFQFNDGTSDQLVIDSYEIFREDLSSPGFLESEFVIVNDFFSGNEFIVEEPVIDNFGDGELLAIIDAPAVTADELAEVVIDESIPTLEETAIAVSESENEAAGEFIESVIVPDSGEPSQEDKAAVGLDLPTDNVRKARDSQLGVEHGHRSVADKHDLSVSEKQNIERLSKRDQRTASQARAVRPEGRDRLVEDSSQSIDRWRKLRQQAVLVAGQIAASGAGSQISGFHNIAVVPATSGSLAMNWGATIAAFAQSTLEDQLQGLTDSDTDTDQLEDSAAEMTYAQAASAAGTLLIGTFAVFRATQKRRKARHRLSQNSGDSIAARDTRRDFSTNNAGKTPHRRCSMNSGFPVRDEQTACT